MPSKKTVAEIKNRKSVKEEALKPVKVVAKAKVSLSAPAYDSKGAKAGTVSLPEEIFGAKINKPLMAQAVRVYLANQRQGNASTKTRGEITTSTRKIYRQKGTGRARHGAASAPIFVAGGVAHGPHPRDFSLSLPKKMRKAALFSALSQRQKDGEVKVISGLLAIEPKTKLMNQVVTKLTDDKKNKKTSLLITPSAKNGAGNVYKAGRNIKNLEVMSANMLNTYEVLKFKNLFFMKESLALIGKGVEK